MAINRTRGFAEIRQYATTILRGEILVAGAANAGLMAAQIIALSDAKLGERLVKWRAARAQELLQQKIP